MVKMQIHQKDKIVSLEAESKIHVKSFFKYTQLYC